MHNSKSYDEWCQNALIYDEIQGNNIWREKPKSMFYDHELVQSRINSIQEMIANDDVFTLMFRLRGSIKRYAISKFS